jgi:hypothetical protein
MPALPEYEKHPLKKNQVTQKNSVSRIPPPPLRAQYNKRPSLPVLSLYVIMISQN